MSEYQFYGYKISDFGGVDALLKQISIGHDEFQETISLALSKDDPGFVVDVKSFDEQEGAGHSKEHTAGFLGKTLVVGDIAYPMGSQIVAEHVFRTDARSTSTLVFGRILAGADTMRKSGLIVFTSTKILPDHPIRIIGGHPSTDNGPGQNCFARGTLIDTPHGALPIEQLGDGDEVVTQDGSVQLISWLGRKRLCGLELVLNPSLRPVRIMAGALAGGRPGQDLAVSQNHRLLVDDWRAPFLFGEDEILAPAKSLLNNKNVYIDCPPGGVEYFHLLMDRHQMVCANGLWAETMLPDATTLNLLAKSQRAAVTACVQGHADVSMDEFRAVLPALPHQSAVSIAA